MELSSPRLKKRLISQEGIFQARKTKKNTLKKFAIFPKQSFSFISGNGTF